MSVSFLITNIANVVVIVTSYLPDRLVLKRKSDSGLSLQENIKTVDP